MSASTEQATTPATDVDPDDPREQIIIGVLMENNRLAPRSFATREEAQKWALPQEQVVEWNYVCDCDG